MECDIRNRIWAAWHLLHFQLNNSLKLQELLLTCYSRSLRALVTSLLWADPWHISASSTGTAAGNCLLGRRNGSHTETWVQNEELQHQFRNPEKNPNILPSVSLLVHKRSDTQSSMPQSLSTLSGKDVACKYKSLLAYEKPHCRRQHIPQMQALCIWEARDTISSVSLQTNSATLHFYLDFLLI